jgi:hypothetical protein
MSAPNPVLKDGKICSDQLEEVVGMALQSLKTLMADYETPIEVRLHIALRLFEAFGSGGNDSNNKKNDDSIMNSLEKNAHDIERNAHQLQGIETLLKLAVQSNAEPAFPSATYSHSRERSKIINH